MAFDYSKVVGTSIVSETNKGTMRWADADTTYGADGQGYRLAGLQANEVQHITDTGIIPGQWGGASQTAAVARLANTYGFTNIEETGDTTYGRKVAHFKNDKGEDLTDTLYSKGIIPVGKWASQKHVDLAEQGWFHRKMKERNALVEGVPLVKDDWDTARDEIHQAARDTARKDADGNIEWKKIALNEEELSAYKNALGEDYSPYKSSSVQYRHGNRDLEGNAYSVFDAGWDQGWNSIKESSYGGLQILGDVLNNDWLTRKGELGAARLAAESRNLPKFVQSWGDMEFGENFGEYMLGMAGVALPYMLGIAGSAAAASVAAPALGLGVIGTGIASAGLGLGAPVWVYSGEVYNNMEGTQDEKNAGVAVAGGLAMAVLDRLGLKGIMSPAQVLKKEGWRQMHDQLTNRYVKEALELAGKSKVGLSETELLRRTAAAQRKATNEIADAQKWGAKGLVKGLMGEADIVINKGLLLKEVGLGTLKGSTIEGFTEVGQEVGGYLASVAGSEKKLNYEELHEIATNALAGGILLGGTIAGATTGAGGYGDIKTMQKQHALAAERSDDNFSEGTVESNVEELTESIPEGLTGQQAMDEIEAGNKQAKLTEKGFFKTLKDSPGELFQKGGSIMHGEFMTNKAIPKAGRKALGVLLDLYARSNISYQAGVGMNAAYRNLTEKYKTDATRIQGLVAATFQVPGTRKNVKEVTKKFKRYIQDKQAGRDVSEFDSIAPQLDALQTELTKLTDNLRETVMKATGEKIGKLDNWFFESARFSPTKIRKQKGKFIVALQKEYDYTAEQAEEFYEQQVMTGTFNMATNGAFRGEIRSGGATKERVANIADNPRMQQFLEDDHFSKLGANIDSMIDYALTVKFLGKNDEKLHRQIMATKQAMGDHWNPIIAKRIMDSVNVGRGEYKPIKNKKIKEAMDVVSFVNALTQLDTSVLASLPEMSLVLLSSAADGTLVKTVGQIAKAMKSHYGKAIKDSLSNVKASGIPSVEDINPSMADVNLNSLSFYNTGYGTTAGVLAHIDVDAAGRKGKQTREKVLEMFFRLNLLKGLTDSGRVARLAIANDAIFADMETIHGFYNQDGGNSNYANDAFDRLRELNINPVKASETYKQIVNEISKRGDSDATFQHIYENYPEFYNEMEIARTSWVDNALARPTHEDRPLWYSNPHLRLFTQYQGFLSTFTSHILPRLWKRAKKADPTLRYQAFAVAAGMLAMAMLGQRLKDEWKYGEESPYIKDDLKKMQRVLNASGLTGTAGRVIDFVHPIYGNGGGKNETSLDQVGRFAGHLTDEAGPFVGTVKSTAKVVGNLLTGDNSRSVLYGAEQFIPIIGRNQWVKNKAKGGN